MCIKYKSAMQNLLTATQSLICIAKTAMQKFNFKLYPDTDDRTGSMKVKVIP